MLHMDLLWSKRSSETEPKRYWIGEVQDQDPGPRPGPVLTLSTIIDLQDVPKLAVNASTL